MGDILRRAWARFPCCALFVMAVPIAPGGSSATRKYLTTLDLQVHSTPSGGASQGFSDCWLSLPQQFRRISRRYCQVRSPKSLQYRKIHADHFPAAIEQRSARPPGSCRRVVNNLVLQHVADMTLRGGWSYQLLRRQLRDHLVYILRAIRDFLGDIRSRSRQNPLDPGRISD